MNASNAAPKAAPKIVIVCALKEEFAAVEAGLGPNYRERFELIRAGVGPTSAARVALELSERETLPNVIVSTGFCGGLVDELHVGDVVVGNEIESIESIELGTSLNSGNDASADSELIRKTTHSIRGDDCVRSIEATLKRANIRAFRGKTICSDVAVSTSEQKRKLGAEGGAFAVDMESYALASNCPSTVLFLRAVSDSVNDELPSEVGEFLDDAGNVRAGKITRFIVKKPSNILRLMELKKRSDLAAKALTDAWRILRDESFE